MGEKDQTLVNLFPKLFILFSASDSRIPVIEFLFFFFMLFHSNASFYCLFSFDLWRWSRIRFVGMMSLAHFHDGFRIKELGNVLELFRLFILLSWNCLFIIFNGRFQMLHIYSRFNFELEFLLGWTVLLWFFGFDWPILDWFLTGSMATAVLIRTKKYGVWHVSMVSNCFNIFPEFLLGRRSNSEVAICKKFGEFGINGSKLIWTVIDHHV